MNIAIQKKGKLTKDSLTFLRRQGIEPETGSDLIQTCRNSQDYLLAVRDDDIPSLVKNKFADVGIVGENVLLESGLEFPARKGLGFGRCQLCLAAPDKEKVTSTEDLEGLTIATSHPKIVKSFLRTRAISAEVIYMAGSVEIAPQIGIADVICDLVVTGETMRQQGLRIIETILTSEAVLIAHKGAALRRVLQQKVGV